MESWDEAGNPTRGKGELVVTKPMPSMPLSFWGDDGSRYHESYFAMYPGVWRHGDYIEFTPRGILIHGRSDSTLNRNGLRLGSADIYTVVESLPEVAEALVVGAELGTDYYMPLFVHLADGADPDVTQEAITRSIRENLSVRYLPDEIVFMPGIPHTRTGKKLEVPVKRLLQGRGWKRSRISGRWIIPCCWKNMPGLPLNGRRYHPRRHRYWLPTGSARRNGWWAPGSIEDKTSSDSTAG